MRTSGKAKNLPAADTPPLALDHVDTSVLDELIAVTQQERQLEQFRTRAEEMKDRVDPAVSARVIADYDTRLRSLRTGAEPLRARARGEYEKLRVLYDDVTARESQARLDRQEIDFRHAVGEMDDAQLAERVKGPDAVLQQCRAELSLLDGHKARFLEVFDEQELASPPAASPHADAPPAPPPDLATTSARAATKPPAAAVSSTEPDLTVLRQMDPVNATMLAPASPASGDTPDDDEGHTFVLPEGILVAIEADGRETEYRLSAMNYIGRSDDNQIRLQRGGVSRRHALIAADRTGFRIKDLGSQNGTSVNGAAVEQTMLADGDVITLGDVTLRFVLPGAHARR